MEYIHKPTYQLVKPIAKLMERKDSTLGKYISKHLLFADTMK